MKKMIFSKNAIKHLISHFLMTTDTKIKIELVAHAYRLLQLGQFASLFCATVILFALYHTYNSNTLLITWYGLYFTIFLLRELLVYAYFKQAQPWLKLAQWKNLFIIGALLSGLSWGLAGSMLFASVNPAEQVLLILIIAGITSGAAPLLSADLLSVTAFISAALIPTIIQLFHAGFTHSIYTAYGITAIAYFIYLILLAIKLHRTLEKMIGLQFANDVLLQNLSQAKDQLETTNKKLSHAATHDPLTDLANRSLFEAKLTQALQAAQNSSQTVALLYIDLDNFKEINDIYGHLIGDKLLLNAVTKLRQATLELDTIARLGGDELAIIMENIPDAKTVHNTASWLCRILASPVIIQNHTITVTASIGISLYPTDGQDTESLLKIADKAMYYVKQQGGNNIRLSAAIPSRISR